MISIINEDREGESMPLVKDGKFQRSKQGQEMLKEEKKTKEDGFGGKSIGFMGGLSLLVNNIVGPAMVTVPLVYQTSGWFTPTFFLIMIAILSALASGFMCEAMACIPGNEHFEGRVEFTTLVNFFFGRWFMIVAQIFINCALQAANIASIIECAQVADSTLIAIFKKTCGVQMYPHPFHWVCVEDVRPSDSPFDSSDVYFFTLGFIVMMALVIPMGYLNLDDNIIVQYLAQVFLVVVTFDFLVAFIMHGFTPSNVPFITRSQAQVLGQVMANYTFVTTIPSWCSEKKPEVSVNKSVWLATGIATGIYFIIGFFGALSYTFPSDGDVLSVIAAGKESNIFDKILVYMFPILILASTIPVFCIIVRYNLVQNRIFPKGIANFTAVVLPWLVSIPFLTGSGLNEILNWGTLIFGSMANFIIPFMVYHRAAGFRDRASVTLTEHQLTILKELGLRGSTHFSKSDATPTYAKIPYQVLPPSLSKYSRKVAKVSAILLGGCVIASIIINLIPGAND